MKIFLALALVAILFSGRNEFSYFGREPTRQHSCEVRITLAQGFRTEEIAFKIIFLRFSIFSSGGHFSSERNRFSFFFFFFFFGRGSPKQHSCEV